VRTKVTAPTVAATFGVAGSGNDPLPRSFRRVAFNCSLWNRFDYQAQATWPSLGRATAWLNSAPLTAADLQGKVVLVDSGRTPASIGFAQCHTFVAWAARYKGTRAGRIGVHTPNSRSRKMSTTFEGPHRSEASTYPIAIDNTAPSGMGSVITIGRRSTSSMPGKVRDPPLRRRQLRRIGNEDSTMLAATGGGAGRIVSPFPSTRMVRRWAQTGAA